MAETDTYKGRKPSFGRTKQGDMFVRGFRSSPGAPMADATNNLPMSPASGTAKSNWDGMFKNSLTGNNPLSPEARAPSAPTSPVDTAMSEIFGFPIGPAATPTPPQPLTVQAAGGPTHAQSWGGDSFSGPSPVTGRTFKNRYGTGSVNFDRPMSAGYGWGSNSRST